MIFKCITSIFLFILIHSAVAHSNSCYSLFFDGNSFFPATINFRHRTVQSMIINGEETPLIVFNIAISKELIRTGVLHEGLSAYEVLETWRYLDADRDGQTMYYRSLWAQRGIEMLRASHDTVISESIKNGQKISKIIDEKYAKGNFKAWQKDEVIPQDNLEVSTKMGIFRWKRITNYEIPNPEEGGLPLIIKSGFIKEQFDRSRLQAYSIYVEGYGKVYFEQKSDGMIVRDWNIYEGLFD